MSEIRVVEQPKLLKYGFTGTQRGTTKEQRNKLGMFLSFVTQIGSNRVEWHHGDCIGADEDSHLIAQCYECEIIIHPTNISGKRAYCEGAKEIREVKKPLVRNKDIVDETDLLFACPAGMKEEVRSGTWSTVRYARKQGKRILIIYPDGSLDVTKEDQND